MQFFKKNIFLTTALSSSIVLFTACAPESKYNGGNGALRSYESMDAYGNSTIKYRAGYTQQSQSSFSSTLVANDRDNIRQTPQNNRAMNRGSTSRQTKKSGNKNNTQNNTNSSYESPVQGDGSFKPTQSLLGGMRDSEAIQRATMRPYTVRGKTYHPHPVKVGDTFEGVASWYGPDFHAKATSNGETYNMYAHTAANKTLPMNTIVKVYNKDNGKITVVRINDRGPFVEGRIIDLSNVAAHDIAMVGKGIANVKIEVVGFGGNLKNNTPPKDSENIDSKTNTSNMPTKQSKEVEQRESIDTQERAILKPRETNDNEMVKDSQDNTQNYTSQATSSNETYKDEEISNIEPNNKNTYTKESNNENEVSPNKSQQIAQTNINSQNSNIQPTDKQEVDNSDDNTLEVSEEELPSFDMPQEKQQPNKEQKQVQTQPNHEESIESAFTSVTPKKIDNTETLKDIDMAVQKLKDSTDDIAKKVQEEMAKKANENKEKEDLNKDSKEPNQQEMQPKEKPQEAKTTDTTKPTEKPQERIENKQNVANFMVSLNVFSHKDRAEHFQDDVRKITYNTPYTIDIVPTDKGLYRVALRGFKTYQEAKDFIAKQNITGHVVQESKNKN